jgi:methylated-DNA-[protein]-cysteine S-methyltransferase
VTGCALFDTAIGRVGVAWSEAGLTRVAFPEAGDAATLARLERGGAVLADPPAPVRAAMDAIAGLLASGRGDLTGIALDLAGALEPGILDAARAIPAGETVTYGELAARLGRTGEARAVGAAMAANPCPIVVPCHRVLASGGGFGGFSAPGGLAFKIRLLNIERAGAGEGLFDHLPFAAKPK